MALASLLLVTVLAAGGPGPEDYFAIRVVDDATGRGVPLVELRTVDQSRYWTDSQGLVAFYEPGLMNRTLFFWVSSHGYEFAADGFGFRGKALKTVPGGEAELRLARRNIAERLYRVTGAGIYRDSVLLGRETPLAQPLLNAQVAGSDSVNTAVFGGRIHWFWGDTNRPAYPLGTFHVPGAVSRLPGDGGLDPRLAVDLEYFTRDDGFAASTAEMPGDGPTWIDGLCVLRDASGSERMFAKYVKVRKFLEVYERGLVEFDGDSRRFEKVTQFDFAAPLYPHGHALHQAAERVAHVYFGNPFPLVRVAATPEALRDPAQYEAFTCLAEGGTLADPRIDRRAGRARYAWKRNTPAPTAGEQKKWIESRLLKPGEGLLALCDAETGKAVEGHAGSVAWNAYRQRYVMIVEQNRGTSNLGEIWYAEADTPLGPWIYARKIVTHDKYSFYNPRHHAMFDQEGGRRIFFEGTYSTFFSGNDAPTPRYDYNQVMYSLDLDDPRLVLPVPVYERATDAGQRFATSQTRTETPTPAGPIAFLAPDRPRAGLVAVGSAAQDGAALSLGDTDPPLFYALPAGASDSPAATVPVYRWSRAAAPRYWYGVAGRAAPAGYERDSQPLCRVWRNPIEVEIDWQSAAQ